MTDPIAILRAHAADLRDMAMTIERAIDDMARKFASGDRLSCGTISDKPATLTDMLLAPALVDHRGNSIPLDDDGEAAARALAATVPGVDSDGYALMRPNDFDPENGRRP